MKKFRSLSLLLVVLIMGVLFTGCSKDDKELKDAFVKSQEILSFESASNLAFNLSAEGLDGESEVVFNEIAKQINNMNLSINQKSSSNEDKTIAKAKVDTQIQLDGMNFDTSIWVDMDMSGDKPVMKQVFKLPSMLMSEIPGAADKEYMVLDFESMNEAMTELEPDMSEQMNMNATMDIAMKYQEKFTDGLIEYVKGYDFDHPIVTKLDDQVVNNETIKYYEIALDNDSFKEFLEYTAVSILEDDKILPLFEEYMVELVEASGVEMPEESIIGDTKEMVAAVTEFFASIADLNILGEDGVSITLGINEEGYFASESGKIDFMFDAKALYNLMDAPEDEMPAPVFKLSVSYNSEIKKINEDIVITMPTTTEANSVDYMDLLETLISEMETELPQEVPQGLHVIVEDELVEFINEPILVNDHYLVSTRDMASEFDADISWDGDSKEIVIKKDENLLVFNVDKNQLVANGKLQDIETDIVIKDSVSYVPLRAIAENLGYKLDWNQDFQMMLVYK